MPVSDDPAVSPCLEAQTCPFADVHSHARMACHDMAPALQSPIMDVKIARVIVPDVEKARAELKSKASVAPGFCA